MRIRRAERADEERLGTIRHDAILALAVPILSQEEAEAWAMQIAEDRISRALREHEVWVAVDKTVIGWVEIDKDRIAALYVSPDYANRGVGSTLLVFAETSISRCGHRGVQLEASRNALNFYLRRGYVQCGLPDSEEAYPLYKELSAREHLEGKQLMANEAKAWWEANAREFQEMVQLPIDVIYGTHVNEEKLQLIGAVAGKQILEIGCGGAQCGIAFAKQGAIVTGVDIAAAQLEIARELAEQNGVSITFHQRDMTDLTPIASESQDIVFSSIAFHYVDDIVSCFKEVHRVLKPQGLFVFSIEHPFSAMMDGATLLPYRSYFDTGKVVSGLEVSDEVGYAFAENRRTVSDFFSALVGAGFIVEQMIEPDVRPVDPADPKNHRWGQTPQFLEQFPGILIFKSKKGQLLPP